MIPILRRLRFDEGSTLIEVLMTIAIMAIAFVAILGGVALAIYTSDIHRKQATANTILRGYADAVQASPAWPGCFQTTGANMTSNYGPSAVTFTVASGFSASVTAVQFWDGSAFQSYAPPSTCSTDHGTQHISLQVQSADAKVTENIGIIKRCSGVLGTGANQCLF